MNTFVIKKLGEVHAFTMNGTATLEKAGAPLRDVVGEEVIADWEEKNTLYRTQIEKIARDEDALEALLAKSESTQTKLAAMRDLYIKDAWDNPTEVLEWLSFYYGAAYAHWGVICGAAEALNNEEFVGFAEDAMQSCYECLDVVANELESVGQERGIE